MAPINAAPEFIKSREENVPASLMSDDSVVPPESITAKEKKKKSSKSKGLKESSTSVSIGKDVGSSETPKKEKKKSSQAKNDAAASVSLEEDLKSSPDSAKKSKKEKKKSSKSKTLNESAPSRSLEEGLESSPEMSTPTKKKKKLSKSMKGLTEEYAASSSVEEEDVQPHETSKKSEKDGEAKKNGNDSQCKMKDKSASKALESPANDFLAAPDGKPSAEKEFVPCDEDKIIALVTKDIWATKGTEALEELLTLNENCDCLQNRQLSIKLGAPLVVVRKMKDFSSNKAVQSVGLRLLRSWASSPSAPWYQIVSVGGLECVNRLLLASLSSTDNNDLAMDAKLRESAFHLLEQMAQSSTAGKYLLGHQGVDTLVHCFRHHLNLRPRALEALKTLCTTTGTAGCKSVTEHANIIIQNSEDSKLLSSTLGLLGSMVTTEDTTKGFLQGWGVEALVYAYQVLYHDKPSVSQKACDLLLMLATNGGSTSRQAIVDSGVLDTFVKRMGEHPKDEELQKRSCQMILVLVEEHRKVVKETGVFMLISKVFSVHRNRQVLKVAHDAMDAMVSR